MSACVHFCLNKASVSLSLFFIQLLPVIHLTDRKCPFCIRLIFSFPVASLCPYGSGSARVTQFVTKNTNKYDVMIVLNSRQESTPRLLNIKDFSSSFIC